VLRIARGFGPGWTGQGNTPFAELFAASQRSRGRIFAAHSPFGMKDHLKARGYRWSDGSDGRPKSWGVEITDDLLDEELRYLRTQIYRWPDANPPLKRLTALERIKA
jgi:DNA polymerase-3 subunit epsilon